MDIAAPITTKPFLVYGSDNIEQGAYDQFFDCLNEDDSVRGALMADAHQGYAMPIGGVIGTKNTLYPAWVGYDIGCGVQAVQTTFAADRVIKNKDMIYMSIVNKVPMGFNHQKEEQDWYAYKHLPKTEWMGDTFTKDGTGFKQIGTLGGGNHFIEISQSSNDGTIWIIVHSGSRNIGHKTATHYMKLASPDGKAREANYGLDISSAEGRSYLSDVRFCQQFAQVNRSRIARYIGDSIKTYTDTGYIMPSTVINRNHNFVEWDAEFELWVHRKGATSAKNKEMGVIPGNMRDGTFIVLGKGNKDSLFSCSHGAGRVLSRKKAKEQLDLEQFKEDMKGVYSEPTAARLDESPRAYKDIKQVMEAQSELVEIVDWLEPLINIKA